MYFMKSNDDNFPSTISTASSQPEWLRTSEVAARLRVGEPTIRRLVTTGELRGYRVGRVWRFRLADVDTYIRGAEIEQSES